VEDNVKYLYAVRVDLVTKGHFCKLLFSTHHKVICQVQEIIIKEELTHPENNKEPILERGKSRSNFVNNWIMEHKLLLNNALGVENGPELKFLTGVLFATSTSKLQASFLEDVIQTDSTHMSLGKYTMFSAYAGSANGKMVALGFAILFGNEDKKLEFLTKTHRIINLQTKMITTDQDKGGIASINEFAPEANLFHCSFHCQQNILKRFGGVYYTTITMTTRKHFYVGINIFRIQARELFMCKGGN
jgi:hypothetical protein